MEQQNRIELMLRAIIKEMGKYPSFDEEKRVCNLHTHPVKALVDKQRRDNYEY